MGGQQSNCARPKSKIDDTENPTVISVSPPVLTAKEKGLLTESWKLLEQKVASVGVIAFTGMFKTHPQAQDYFLPFLGLNRTENEYSDVLRQHALRVMATVEKCINRLEEPDRMKDVLETLGCRHVGFHSNIDYVDVLGSQFLLAVKEHSPKWDDDLEAAWRSLFDVITFHIKTGWAEQLIVKASREAASKKMNRRSFCIGQTSRTTGNNVGGVGTAGSSDPPYISVDRWEARRDVKARGDKNTEKKEEPVAETVTEEPRFTGQQHIGKVKTKGEVEERGNVEDTDLTTVSERS